MIQILLLILIIEIAAAWWRAEVRHRQLMRLLSDFATMVGDMADME